MFSYYNNESLRKLVLGFGNLFNDMYVGKYDKDGNLTEKDRVPLTYGPKEKFIRRIKEVSTISDVTRSRITLPRMGFEMLGMSYDPTRKANKLRITSGTVSDGEAQSGFSAVPYLVNFGLYTFTRNIDENLQLVEQILPYFSPEFIISVNFNDVDKKVNVPIVLTSTGISEIYEGDFSETRSITTTFSFIAKTYVYGKIAPSPVVTESELRMFEGDFDSDTVRPTDSIGIVEIKSDNETPVNIFSTQTKGPFAVSGYYPLYSNAEDAVRASPFPNLVRDGETTVGYHTHILGGVLYYMPNGLIMNKTMFHGNYVDTNPDDPGPDIIDEENQEDLPLVRIGAAGGNRPRRPEDIISGSIKSLLVVTQGAEDPLGISEQGDMTEAEWVDDFLLNSDERIRQGIENYLNGTDRGGVVRSTYLNEDTTGYIQLDIEAPMNLGLVRFYSSPERKESAEKFVQGIILRLNAWREVMPNAKFGVWRFGDGLDQSDNSIEDNPELIPLHYANQVELSLVRFKGKSLFESVDFLSPGLFQEIDRDDSIEGSEFDDDDARILAGERTNSVILTCDAIIAANDTGFTGTSGAEPIPVIPVLTRGYIPGVNETGFDVYNGPWAGEKNAAEMYYLKDYANHFIFWYPENSAAGNQTLEQFDEVPSTREPIQPDEVGLTDEERLLLEVEKIHNQQTDSG
jgi:hypothetical protein